MRMRALVAAVVLGLALVPGAAGATDTSGGCGTHGTSEFHGSASCNFFFQGFPLMFWASTTVPSGQADVHIRVTAYDAPLVTLLECTDAGQGSAYCEVAIPDGVTYVQYRNMQTLSCFVEGRGVGHFWCQSAHGI